MHLPVSPSLRPSPSVYLHLTYSVICHRSCMTSYPFPATSHRRRWCNEAGPNRTMSSAAKWSESPQDPQTNTSTADARMGFFWPPLDAWRQSQETRLHAGFWTCEPRKEQKNTSRKRKKTWFDTKRLKAGVEAREHLGQSRGKKQVSTDGGSAWEAKAGHKLDNIKYKE